MKGNETRGPVLASEERPGSLPRRVAARETDLTLEALSAAPRPWFGGAPRLLRGGRGGGMCLHRGAHTACGACASRSPGVEAGAQDRAGHVPRLPLKQVAPFHTA